ncbi:MAG: hypothetical protein J7M14_00660 [Planctomycetes bacterium]|nr:hypothetical protein [Planctomycetota bacterium]
MTVLKKEMTRPAQQRNTVTARIVRQDKDQAIVEVVCECGNKIMLTCRYGSEQADRESSEQASQA